MIEEPAAGPQPVRLFVDELMTPIGRLTVVCNSAALSIVEYEGFGGRMHTALARRYDTYELIAAVNPLGVTAQLERYFDGDPAALDALLVDAGGTAYQRRVWDLLRTIPHGQTRTYGQLAAQLGNTHARAVGHANSLNPIAIVVPCHRVIGADATLTGYAGGLHRKQWLLDHEASHRALPLPFARAT